MLKESILERGACSVLAKFYNLENSIFNGNSLSFKSPERASVQNSTFFKNDIIPNFPVATDTIIHVNNSIFWPLPGNPAPFDKINFPFIALSVQVKNCLFTDTLHYASIPTGYVEITGPTIQIGPDPLFADTLNGDFHLRPCSPAWNAGDNASTIALGLTTDLDGLLRIVDGQVDIGPYEAPALGSGGPATVQAACFNLPQGAVQWDLRNGCPPYAYQWTSGSNMGSSTTGLVPGSYLFTITDSRGRTLVQGTQIPASAPQLSLQGDSLICPDAANGDLLALVGGAVEPVSYLWSQGGTGGSLSNLAPGSYSATATDAIGCKDTATASIGITPPVVADAQIGLASTLTTANGSIQVSVQSGQPPYTFAWGEVASTLPNISGLLPGFYHLYVTDGAGCTTNFQYEVGVVSATTAAPALLPGSVQPNPAQGQALLRFGDSRTWQLYSVSGVEVLRVESPGTGREMVVDLSGLPVGLYFYAFSDQGKVISQDRLFILGK